MAQDQEGKHVHRYVKARKTFIGRQSLIEDPGKGRKLFQFFVGMAGT